MPELSHVNIARYGLERFARVLPPDRQEEVMARTAQASEMLEGRVLWNLNSTAQGGGVAEMLPPLLGYARGVNVDARWTVIGGDPDFFRVTKRLHNHLHGSPGDGGFLDDEAKRVYQATTDRNAEEFRQLVRVGDVVILHDPQTAGLIPMVRDCGAKVIWRCHIGVDHPNDIVRNAWDFLREFVEQADAYVFSRRAFEWSGLEHDKTRLIAPTIDAFGPKNQDLDDPTATAILVSCGVIDGDEPVAPTFSRADGSPGRVDRRVEATEARPLQPGERYVLQVSRWDRLKDPIGVIDGFVQHTLPHTDAHLLYAGPSVAAVADDPEGAEVLGEARSYWANLDDDVRERVHLLALPMEDPEENAAIVNALQREATVVIQKSIAEGFGLTISEAMWKGRPIVASRVGGIQDQVIHEETGLLVDARDLEGYGTALRDLLNEPRRARAMGNAGRERVRSQYLGFRSLLNYIDLIEELLR